MYSGLPPVGGMPGMGSAGAPPLYFPQPIMGGPMSMLPTQPGIPMMSPQQPHFSPTSGAYPSAMYGMDPLIRSQLSPMSASIPGYQPPMMDMVPYQYEEEAAFHHPGIGMRMEAAFHHPGIGQNPVYHSEAEQRTYQHDVDQKAALQRELGLKLAHPHDVRRKTGQQREMEQKIVQEREQEGKMVQQQRDLKQKMVQQYELEKKRVAQQKEVEQKLAKQDLERKMAHQQELEQQLAQHRQELEQEMAQVRELEQKRAQQRELEQKMAKQREQQRELEQKMAAQQRELEQKIAEQHELEQKMAHQREMEQKMRAYQLDLGQKMTHNHTVDGMVHKRNDLNMNMAFQQESKSKQVPASNFANVNNMFPVSSGVNLPGLPIPGMTPDFSKARTVSNGESSVPSQSPVGRIPNVPSSAISQQVPKSVADVRSKEVPNPLAGLSFPNLTSQINKMQMPGDNISPAVPTTGATSVGSTPHQDGASAHAVGQSTPLPPPPPLVPNSLSESQHSQESALFATSFLQSLSNAQKTTSRPSDSTSNLSSPVVSSSLGGSANSGSMPLVMSGRDMLAVSSASTPSANNDGSSLFRYDLIPNHIPVVPNMSAKRQSSPKNLTSHSDLSVTSAAAATTTASSQAPVTPSPHSSVTSPASVTSHSAVTPTTTTSSSTVTKPASTPFMFPVMGAVQSLQLMAARNDMDMDTTTSVTSSHTTSAPIVSPVTLDLYSGQDPSTRDEYVWIAEDKFFSCTKCHYLTHREDKIQQHARAHHGRYICQLCGKAFIKSCDLDRHMVAHKLNRIRPHMPKSTSPKSQTSPKGMHDEFSRRHFRFSSSDTEDGNFENFNPSELEIVGVSSGNDVFWNSPPARVLGSLDLVNSMSLTASNSSLQTDPISSMSQSNNSLHIKGEPVISMSQSHTDMHELSSPPACSAPSVNNSLSTSSPEAGVRPARTDVNPAVSLVKSSFLPVTATSTAYLSNQLANWSIIGSHDQSHDASVSQSVNVSTSSSFVNVSASSDTDTATSSPMTRPLTPNPQTQTPPPLSISASTLLATDSARLQQILADQVSDDVVSLRRSYLELARQKWPVLASSLDSNLQPPSELQVKQEMYSSMDTDDVSGSPSMSGSVTGSSSASVDNQMGTQASTSATLPSRSATDPMFSPIGSSNHYQEAAGTTPGASEITSKSASPEKSSDETNKSGEESGLAPLPVLTSSPNKNPLPKMPKLRPMPQLRRIKQEVRVREERPVPVDADPSTKDNSACDEEDGFECIVVENSSGEGEGQIITLRKRPESPELTKNDDTDGLPRIENVCSISTNDGGGGDVNAEKDNGNADVSMAAASGDAQRSASSSQDADTHDVPQVALYDTAHMYPSDSLTTSSESSPAVAGMGHVTPAAGLASIISGQLNQSSVLNGSTEVALNHPSAGIPPNLPAGLSPSFRAVISPSLSAGSSSSIPAENISSQLPGFQTPQGMIPQPVEAMGGIPRPPQSRSAESMSTSNQVANICSTLDGVIQSQVNVPSAGDLATVPMAHPPAQNNLAPEQLSALNAAMIADHSKFYASSGLSRAVPGKTDRTGNPLFRCHICSYSTKSQWHLDKHYLAHTRNYKTCRFCKKAFERPSDLFRHEERHVNRLPLNNSHENLLPPRSPTKFPGPSTHPNQQSLPGFMYPSAENVNPTSSHGLSNMTGLSIVPPPVILNNHARSFLAGADCIAITKQPSSHSALLTESGNLGFTPTLQQNHQEPLSLSSNATVIPTNSFENSSSQPQTMSTIPGPSSSEGRSALAQPLPEPPHRRDQPCATHSPSPPAIEPIIVDLEEQSNCSQSSAVSSASQHLSEKDQSVDPKPTESESSTKNTPLDKTLECAKCSERFCKPDDLIEHRRKNHPLLPTRVDFYLRSFLLETSIAQCDVGDDNDITVHLTAPNIEEMTRLPPHVSSMEDISKIKDQLVVSKDTILWIEKPITEAQALASFAKEKAKSTTPEKDVSSPLTMLDKMPAKHGLPSYSYKLKMPKKKPRVFNPFQRRGPEVSPHMKISYRWRCDKCNYGTNFHHKMLEHEAAHTAGWICKLCNKAFIKAADLTRHWVTHNEVVDANGSIRCDSCRFTSPSADVIENHMKWHYKGGSQKGKQFSPAGVGNSNGGMNMFGASLDASQMSYPGLAQDLANHPSFDQNIMPQPEIVDGSNYIGQLPSNHTPMGDLDYQDRSSLLQSDVMSTPRMSQEQDSALTGGTDDSVNGDPFKNQSYTLYCPDCNAGFNSPTEMMGHQIREHDMPEPELWCRHCDRLFATAATLRRHHRRIKMRQKLKYAPYNTASFSYYNMTARSRARATCPVCYKTFSSTTYCRQHMVLHTNERPYHCGRCGRNFALKQALNTHQSKDYCSPENTPNKSPYARIQPIKDHLTSDDHIPTDDSVIYDKPVIELVRD